MRKKRAAVYDLYKYSKTLSETGHPPIHGTSSEALLTDWKNQLPGGAVNQAVTKTSNITGLSEIQSAWDNADPADRVSDVGLDSNSAARRKVAADLIKQAIETDSIHETLKSVYQDRLELIEKGEFSDGKISEFASQALSQMSKTAGIGDNNVSGGHAPLILHLRGVAMG